MTRSRSTTSLIGSKGVLIFGTLMIVNVLFYSEGGAVHFKNYSYRRIVKIEEDTIFRVCKM